MNINGVESQNAHAHQILKNQNANTAVEDNEDDEQDNLNTIPAVESPEEETDNGSGVIKNLLNSHYKSVPAMRLYLNHYDKIAAANSELTDPIVAEGIGNIQGITGTVQDFLDSQQSSGKPELAEIATALEAVESEELPESPDIIGIFNAAVEQAGQDFMNSPNPQTETLVEGLQNAFDALVAGLTPPQPEQIIPPVEPAVLDEPIVTEEPVVPEEPIVSDEPVVANEPQALTPAEQFEEFIAGLTASFTGFLNTLQETLAAANTIELPAAESFTRPSNNGSAYDKFLEMYKELPGVPTAPMPTAPVPPPVVEQPEQLA